MPNLWIQNARVIDPAAKRDARGDLFVVDGKLVPSLSSAQKNARKKSRFFFRINSLLNLLKKIRKFFQFNRGIFPI